MGPDSGAHHGGGQTVGGEGGSPLRENSREMKVLIQASSHGGQSRVETEEGRFGMCCKGRANRNVRCSHDRPPPPFLE